MCICSIQLISLPLLALDVRRSRRDHGLTSRVTLRCTSNWLKAAEFITQLSQLHSPDSDRSAKSMLKVDTCTQQKWQ